jgi:hypothetical protein
MSLPLQKQKIETKQTMESVEKEQPLKPHHAFSAHSVFQPVQTDLSRFGSAANG